MGRRPSLGGFWNHPLRAGLAGGSVFRAREGGSLLSLRKRKKAVVA